MSDIQPEPAQTTTLGPDRRKRRLPTAVAILGVVVVVAVAGTAAAEIYYRHRVEGCVAAQTEQQLGDDVSVGFGLRPLLLTRLDNRIPTLTVDTDNAHFGPAINMTVHARLNDIHLQDSGRTANIGSTSAEAIWSDQAIAQTLHGLASDVTSNSGTGTVSMTVLGGLAHFEVRPQVVDHTIQIDTVSSRGLPSGLVDQIMGVLTQSLQTLPLDTKADSLTVTNTGITVQLSGGQTTLHGSGDSC
ncbi:DUF2993 domain-containing protein [Nocardia sp. CDC153]|uniref:LmeA family phospholipid-binding protein n=1 Tax=Nocardia sp. CDC153 TaxID=3112167 RepID=UPI002DBDE91A|nr:DUF2993 domain-containing protein [Nocardia sp. CDC153]MEC3953946.1 DUF2993 domain-containing protein [Nocardia sp. CDC153]